MKVERNGLPLPRARAQPLLEPSGGRQRTPSHTLELSFFGNPEGCRFRLRKRRITVRGSRRALLTDIENRPFIDIA
jgi:hypothetical protein